MDIWVFVNPFLRTLLYFSCFGAIGTSLFLFHFGNLLGSQGIIYCNKLRSRSSLLGIIISLATVFSIAGTLGGEIFSAFDVTMLELTFETKIGRSTFFVLLGFCYYLHFLTYQKISTFCWLCRERQSFWVHLPRSVIPPRKGLWYKGSLRFI